MSTETANVEPGKAFALLFAQNPLPMCLFDDESLRFLEVNDAAIELYGYSREEFRAMRITEIHSPDEVKRLLAYRSTDRRPFRRAGIWRQRRKDDTIIEVEIHSHTLEFAGRGAVLVVMHDLSEQSQRVSGTCLRRSPWAAVLSDIWSSRFVGTIWLRCSNARSIRTVRGGLASERRRSADHCRICDHLQ